VEWKLKLSDQDAQASSSGEARYSAFRFTTDALPERERLPVWREEFGRTLVRIDIEPLSDETLHAEAEVRALPGLRTLRFKGSRMRFHRTRSMAAAGDDSIGLILSHDAGTSLSHRNCDFTLDHGDACLVLTDEPGMVDGRAQLGILFPRAPLVARAKNVADATAIRISRDSDALRLLTGYLNAISEQLALHSPKLQRTVLSHVYDLVTLAMCPDRPVDDNSLSATAAARLQLALAYINKHFDRPGLTISAVARDQNVSPRYLQRLIETTGSTFSEHMNGLRLGLAYSLLTNARHRQDRISDIALRAGFSDVAHFNRSFRRRFGDTPRNVRAGGLGEKN
jgi:AraC-like DNA-binding protein